MKLKLVNAVLNCLKEQPEAKLTARQIAEWIFITYPAECKEKKSNSRGDYIKNDADLVQQLVAEISSQRPRLQKQHPEVKTICGRSLGSARSVSMRNAHLISAGQMAIVGCIRTWSGWRIWALSGIKKYGTA